MVELFLIACVAISFLVTLAVTPYWIARARKAGLVGADMNKFDKPKIAEAGGIAVVAGLLAGLLLYIGVQTFVFESNHLIELLALLSTLLIITLIGFIDDSLGWKLGLRRWQRPLLCLLAALPLMAISAGQSTMNVPFFGPVNFGLFYPLLLVPLAITGAANGFNMLAGFNGLEAGLGIIILGTLGVITYQSGVAWVSLICACAVFALLAFLFYNRFPARVFPGNTLTYSIGALIAAVAILGNTERAALILFLPFFAELVLKARGGFVKESFAKPQPDGSLELPYKEIYGLEHAMVALVKKVRKKAYETEVIYALWLVELLIAFTLLV